ncbi:hypothetical protein [Clostridium magnum]|uniref:Uncharacterized protein n=1 Tax=Clostridium magnum DSM 2767 TaxID=1121326 RepID=A0A162QST0_9CLOT|nr:hypothetical protein [Clostridium magnum]KZL88915.1 hypothetical protein CLMAG_58190 [Clostridium magnum DSM 2767]SHI53200.1 hypothetical protein SAMN02745944_04466 [Clostridium magnum DSM 2767]
MTRLNAYIDGDQSAVYKNWHDKKGSSSGNTGNGNSRGAGYNKQTTPNTQNTNSSEGQANASSTQTGAKGNSSTGNTTNFASPGQINYVKSLIKKTNQDEAALLQEYNAESIEKLTISQANVIIKKLSAIVA